MKLSLKSLGLFVGWLSFVMALFAYTRSLASPGTGFSIRAASELLMFANLLFALVSISVAIGSLPKRNWIAIAIVAVVLVGMQLTNLLPVNLAHAQGEKILMALTPPNNMGGAGWHASYSAEFATLLVYSWTPLVAFMCGRLSQFVCTYESEAG